MTTREQGRGTGEWWHRTAEGWSGMSFANQMGNAGMEVLRCLDARRAGELGHFAGKADYAARLLAATAECQVSDPANLRRVLRAWGRFTALLAGDDPRGEAVLERYFTAWGLRANEERRAARG